MQIKPVNFFDFSRCNSTDPNKSSESINYNSTVESGPRRLGPLEDAPHVFYKIREIENKILSIESKIYQIRDNIHQHESSIGEKENQQESLLRARESMQQTFASTHFKNYEARDRKAEINGKETEKNKAEFERLTNEINNLYKEIDKNNDTMLNWKEAVELLKGDQKILYYRLVKVAKKEELNEILTSFSDSVSNLDVAAIEGFFEKLEPTEKLNELKNLILKNIAELNSFSKEMEEYRTALSQVREDQKREVKNKMVDLSKKIAAWRDANKKIITEIEQILLG